jgi:hypothetical protein
MSAASTSEARKKKRDMAEKKKSGVCGLQSIARNTHTAQP